jgi:hypothetical protein
MFQLSHSFSNRPARAKKNRTRNSCQSTSTRAIRLRPSHSGWLVNMEHLACASKAVRIQTRASTGLFNIDPWGGCASRGNRPGHRRLLSHYAVHRLHRFPDCTVNSVVPQFTSPAQKIGASVRVECRQLRADANPCLPPQAVPFSSGDCRVNAAPNSNVLEMLWLLKIAHFCRFIEKATGNNVQI